MNKRVIMLMAVAIVFVAAFVVTQRVRNKSAIETEEMTRQLSAATTEKDNAVATVADRGSEMNDPRSATSATEEQTPADRFAGQTASNALKMIEGRNFDEGEALLRHLIATSAIPAEVARAHWFLARLLIGRSLFDEAAEHLRAALALNVFDQRETYDLYLDLFRTLVKNGQMDEAMATAETIQTTFLSEGAEAVGDMPADEAKYILLRTMFNLGLNPEAAEYAAQLTASPDFAQKAALLEAKALFALGQEADAVAALQRGIGADVAVSEDLSKLYNELAKYYIKQNDPQAALKMAADALKAFEGTDYYENYLYHMGMLFRRNGIAEWEQLLGQVAASDTEGNREGSLEALAASARREERWADAEKYYQQLYGLPERESAKKITDYMKMIEVLQAQNKGIQPVIASLKTFLSESQSKDAALWSKIGKTLLDAGQSAEAVAFLNRAIESQPGSESSNNALVLLGDAYAAQGQTAQAKAQYEKHIKLMEQAGDLNRALQTALRSAEKSGVKQGSEEWNKAIARANAYLEQIDNASDLMKAFNYFGARDELYPLTEKALALADAMLDDPARFPIKTRADMDTRNMIIHNLMAFGKREEAIQRVDSIISKEKSLPSDLATQLLYFKGLALFDLDRRDEFHAVAKNVLDRAQNNKKNFSEYAAGYAERLYFKDAIEESLPLFQAAVNSEPTHLSSLRARIYLGAEALKQGDLKTAEKHAKVIIDHIRPDDPISLNRGIYWGGVYLQGLIQVKRGGVGAGQTLKKAEKNGGHKWHPFS